MRRNFRALQMPTLSTQNSSGEVAVTGAYYGPSRLVPAAYESAAFIEIFSTAARCTGSARRSEPGPELERARCQTHFDQERAEGSSEAHHGQHEQDGYESRQVDGDECAREKRHDDE